MTLKWEEPAGRSGGGRRDKWRPILDELRSRPGDWAVIAENTTANLGPMLKRTYRGFEFTARGVRNSRAEKVYGRYIGTDNEKEKD